MGLRGSWIWRPCDAGAELLKSVAEPVEEFSGADVRGLPTSVEKATPDRRDGAGRVASPKGMSENVGHAVLEVLGVGAGFKTSDVTPHEDSTELGLRGRGSPLRVAGDVEGVVFFSIEDGGAEVGVLDGAFDAEIDDARRVCGGLLVGHAVEVLGWGCAAAREEVVDEAADEASLRVGEGVVPLYNVASEVCHLWGMGDTHGHSSDLPAYETSVDGVGGAEAEGEHVPYLVRRPSISEHPTLLRDVGEALSRGAGAGDLLLGFGEGVHDVGENGGLGEGGVHGGEVVGGHALGDHLCRVAANVASKLVYTLDDPVATYARLSLASLIPGLEGRADLVQ